MTTKMSMADLELVDPDHPKAQQVAVLETFGQLKTAYAEIPEAGDDDIRVKIKWVGICGSDLEAYRGTRQPEFMTTPTRLGHEVAGVIDQVGKNVHGLQVGDQVTCRYVWGAFAEYIVCKPFNVKVLPPSFPLKETSLIEILPGVIHAAELGQINQNKTVLITGQGVSGLVITQVIALYSPRALVVTDLRDRNLELARKYGATHTYRIPSADTPTMDVVGGDFPDGFDVVVPCLLEGDGMVDALDCLDTCGKIVMYGCIGTCNEPFDFFKLHRKRGEILSTEPKRDVDMRQYFQTGVQWVLDGLINTSEMITHTFPLSDIQAGFELRNDQNNDAIHVLIDCERS
ncbi:MAG: alcohol dehydrogenase catalytic domain-containing protein [Verrucomicrobia bacterium]|nr:alcohol dehydrogenase catalytic domain-containing protein [Verrucomicrobiota bacterium]MCH8527821.1 alcohol dehydrogenase catalytic domain-containing protein [Kiritimatiellia bacterium]